MNDRKRAVRYGISFVILAVLLIFLFIWNVNSGSIHLSVQEILNIIFRHQGDETSYNIVWEIRLPRILAVIILGGALSVSGFLLQTFFNNPIAGPFVLGISSGAKLIVAFLMIFLLSRSVSIGSGAMILAAFAGSMISMGFVLLVVWLPQRKASPFRWRWSIMLISVFITLADAAYFYALTYPDAMISVTSMVRRGSVIVSFCFGAMIFREKNLRSQAVDLCLVLLSMACLWIGGH